MIGNLSHQVSIVAQNLASIGDFNNLEYNKQINASPDTNVAQSEF